MQSITNGVYSLLLGAEGGDATELQAPAAAAAHANRVQRQPRRAHARRSRGRATERQRVPRWPSELSNRVFVEAAKNKNRRTCVLLKTPMTPPAVEETMKTWIAAETANEASNFRARGETPPTPVTPKLSLSAKNSAGATMRWSRSPKTAFRTSRLACAPST